MRGLPETIMRRRTKMLTMKAQGETLRDIVNVLSKEYEVSKNALYMDWNKRGAWARSVVRTEDPTLLEEMIQGLRQVIPNAWFEYKTNPNPSVKLGALRLAKETYLDIIEVLHSTGLLKKMPEALNIGLKWLDDESADNNDQISPA